MLRGEEPAEIDGNLFIDRLVGAEIRYITRAQWQDREQIMQGIAAELTGKGRKSYIIPEGASNVLGSVGYIDAVREMAGQAAERFLGIDYIVNATGSGGTQAGLIMGCSLHMPRAKVLGFNVCDDAEYFRKKINGLIRDTEKYFNVSFNLPRDAVRVMDGYVGKGYAISSDKELDMIQQVASATGIILDPVYNGKAFFGLVKEVEKGSLPGDKTYIFLHSGGIFGLFPKKREFKFQAYHLQVE